MRCPTFNSERPAEARPLWCSRTTTGKHPRHQIGAHERRHRRAVNGSTNADRPRRQPHGWPLTRALLRPQLVLILENTTTMAFHTTSSFTALEQDVVTTGTMGQLVNNDPSGNKQGACLHIESANKSSPPPREQTAGKRTWFNRCRTRLTSSQRRNSKTHRIWFTGTTTPTASKWPLVEQGSGLTRSGTQVKRCRCSTRAPCSTTVAGCRFGCLQRDGNQPCCVDSRRQRLTKHDVANHTDLNTQLGLTVLHQRFPRAFGPDLGWNPERVRTLAEHRVGSNTRCLNRGPPNDGYRLDSIGGDHPTLAILGNAVSSILSLNETGVWSFVAERPAAASRAWDLIRHGQHLILMTTSAPTPAAWC